MCSSDLLDPFASTSLLHHHHQHRLVAMRASSSRTPTRRQTRLVLALGLLFLSSAASFSLNPREWKPPNEAPGAPFVLGDGKIEGSKALGYEGEWPLWSTFRENTAPATLDGLKGAEAKAGEDPLEPVVPGAKPPSTSGSSKPLQNTTYVCAPVGDCTACPDTVIRLPYCRPYNNRRRVACAPVADRAIPASIQSALDKANSASSDASSATSKGVLMGYEACGKSARQEARDYFEMIAVVASIAIFSVWAFIQRQKTLFVRQNQQLQYRVSGRRSSGLPAPPGAPVSALGSNRKKRAARLAPPSSSTRG